MGVGAVFISTLAVQKLPPPSNPPQTQQDILTLSLHPIVSFVVLSSIIVRASAVNNFFLSFNLHVLLDGLSIPFFNLGKNVSRTVSFTTTLTSPRSRFQSDWVLNINRIVATLQESTSEVPLGDVAVHEVASAAASTNTPTSIIFPSQMPDIESGPVVNKRNDDMPVEPLPLTRLVA
jgi:hypothetical protein